MRAAIIFLVLVLPAIVLAQTSTTSTAAIDPNTLTPESLPGVFEWMARAFKSGDWMTGSGLLLTLAIGAFRALGLNKLIPKKYNKWVAGGIAMLTSVAVGLVAHASWWTIVSTGIGTGLAAVGGWEVIVEPVVKWIKKKLGSSEEAPSK